MYQWSSRECSSPAEWSPSKDVVACVIPGDPEPLNLLPGSGGSIKQILLDDSRKNVLLRLRMEGEEEGRDKDLVTSNRPH